MPEEHQNANTIENLDTPSPGRFLGHRGRQPGRESFSGLSRKRLKKSKELERQVSAARRRV